MSGSRPRSMTLAKITAAVLLSALAGCTASSPGKPGPGLPTTPASAATTVRECSLSDLAVGVATDLSILVRNTSPTTCALTGRPPVTMTVGRVDGPPPSLTTYVVPPGGVYVQPQHVVNGRWACPGPISSGAPGVGFWTIQVQGHVAHPRAPRQLLRLVVNCDVFTRSRAYVVVS